MALRVCLISTKTQVGLPLTLLKTREVEEIRFDLPDNDQAYHGLDDPPRLAAAMPVVTPSDPAEDEQPDPEDGHQR